MDPSDLEKLQKATMKFLKAGASVGSKPSQFIEASKELLVLSILDDLLWPVDVCRTQRSTPRLIGARPLSL